jgi:ribonuclease D
MRIHNLGKIMQLHQNDLPDSVKFSGSVAIDTETMGLNLQRDRLCLVQMCSADGDAHLVQIQKNAVRPRNLINILTDKSILKIFHFARFDVAALGKTFGIQVSPIYCTKIASKLTRTYSDKHGLKNLCKDLLNKDISKNEQTSDWGNETLTQEQLKYATGDVLYLHQLKAKLDKMLEREGRADLARRCFEAVETIANLEAQGINPEELFQH